MAQAPLNLREEGRLRVLQALHRTGHSSRVELVRQTGLSKATVSTLVADLMAAGLVREEHEPPGETRRTGRPAQGLSLVPTAAYAIGADIGHQHVRVVLCDLLGEPLWDRFVVKEVDREPAQTLDLVADLVAQALRDNDIAVERVLGIGAGIASPVDKGGELGRSMIMSAWAGLRPAWELERRTGLSGVVTNDANAGALAERLYGVARDTGDMVYVRLSAGIGAGIVVDGQLMLGARGLAGEVGHLMAEPGGRICRCGNRGCLETVASPVAVAELLARSWGEPVTPLDLPRLVAEGNPGACRAVEDAGEAVGRVLASVVTLVDPELVVVGGDLASAGELVLAPVRWNIRKHALSLGARHVSVVAGELGDRAEVRGAAGIVLSNAPRLLATAGVDLAAG
ncbi:ROK family transcriptional regulator [Kutzneria buriramensis]|uniref:Putative NBD/HSP70 family sugar kinase n=1 Tax=Kutzneria buriramensis TaxID=1045776 RepID=A0A3E0I4Z6_9PSEU|nr:ROK family transcriptional regulator [Kutzneria buriramensis]REH53834.1 putative NBD/HSP70 family sugar kinase [Kutzneria buriramensis]